MLKKFSAAPIVLTSPARFLTKNFRVIVIVILIALTVFPAISNAQAPALRSIKKIYGSDGQTITIYDQATDGLGYTYVCGKVTGWDMNLGAGFSSTTNADGIFVAKYSSSGSRQWAFTVGSTTSTNVGVATSIALDGSGNLYVGGILNSASALDMDPSSNTNNISSGSGGQDMFLAKYDATLTPTSASFYKWAFRMGNSGNQGINSIAVTSAGNIYIAANSVANGSIDMDPSSNTNNITNGSAQNQGIVAKYDGTLTPSNTSFYKWAFDINNNSNDEGTYDIVVDNSENIYVSGYISGSTVDFDPSGNTANLSSGGVDDMFLTKYDGTLTPSSTSFYKWAFLLTNAAENDFIYDLYTNNNSLYVVGFLSAASAIDFDPSANTTSLTSAGSDGFVARYDLAFTPSSTSFFKWAFKLGSDAGAEHVNSIIADASENVYIVGDLNTTAATLDMDPSSNTNTISHTSKDAFVARYDGTLTPASTSFYKWAFVVSGPGSGEAANSITLSGNNLSVGFNTTTTSGQYPIDLDPTSGTSDMGVTYTYARTHAAVAVYDVSIASPTTSGFFKIADSYTPDATGTRSISFTCQAKDASGNMYVGGTMTNSVKLDTSTSVATLYSSVSAGYVAKYNSAGVLQWNYVYNNLSAVLALATGSNNELVVAGTLTGAVTMDMDPSSNTNNITGSTGTDMFVAEYDVSVAPTNTGFYKWAFRTGSNGLTTTLHNGSIAITNAGLIYLLGSYEGGVTDFDPTSGTKTLTNSGGFDIFMAKYDGTLTPANSSFFKWAFSINGSGTDIAYRLIADASENIYVGGYFDEPGSVDFDPSTNSNTLTSSGAEEMFVAKYDGTLTPSSTSFYKWAFKLGTSDGTNGDVLRDMAIKGNYLYICGNIGTGTADMDPSSNTNNITGTGPWSMVVAKYDLSFTPSSTSFYKWSFASNNSSELAIANQVEVDNTGLIYLCASVNASGAVTIDMDPSSNTNNLSFSASTSDNIIMAIYNDNFTPSSTSFYVSAFTLTGTGNFSDVALMSVPLDKRIFVRGKLTGTNIDVDPGSATTNFSSFNGGTEFSAFTAYYIANTNVWTGAISDVWTNTGNWSTATLPTSTTDAWIPVNSTNFPVITSTLIPACYNIIIESGAVATVSNAGMLSIYNSITNNGTFNLTTGKIKMAGSSAQTIPASVFNTNTILDLEISNSAGVTLGGTLNLTGTLTPTSGTFTTGGFLTLKSDIVGTGRIAAGSGSYLSGNVTLERYIPSGKRVFRFLGNPTNSALALSTLQDNIYVTGVGGVSNGFDATQNNNPSAYWFNNAAAAPGAWTAITNTSSDLNWTQYRGLRILVRGDRSQPGTLTGGSDIPNAVTLDITGTLNTGNQNMNLTNANNYHFLANPYASPTDIGTVIGAASNIGTQYWVWDAQSGSRGAYVTKLTSGGTYSIPSMSAFIVLPTGSSTLAFTESNKTTAEDNGNNFFRTNSSIPNVGELKLLYNGYSSDNIFIRRDGTATSGFDAQDGKKLWNPDMNIYLVSTSSDSLSLDSRPFVDTVVVPLGFSTTATAANYAIKLDSWGVNGYDLYLRDKLMGTEQKLMPGDLYNFTTTVANPGATRFELALKPTNLLPLSALQLNAQQKGNDIQLNWTIIGEENAVRYEVEYSRDGRNFEKLAAQNANGTKAYSWLHVSVSGTVHYYRIKSIAANGAIMYSSVVKINTAKTGASLSIYPNPVKQGQAINISLNNLEKGMYTLRLMDASGKVVWEKQLNHPGGTTTESITSEKLAIGCYVLSASALSANYIQKIILK